MDERTCAERRAECSGTLEKIFEMLQDQHDSLETLVEKVEKQGVILEEVKEKVGEVEERLGGLEKRQDALDANMTIMYQNCHRHGEYMGLILNKMNGNAEIGTDK